MEECLFFLLNLCKLFALVSVLRLRGCCTLLNRTLSGQWENIGMQLFAVGIPTMCHVGCYYIGTLACHRESPEWLCQVMVAIRFFFVYGDLAIGRIYIYNVVHSE